MELYGFWYEKSLERISANGQPISKELLQKGFIQKDNRDGKPRWYVKPNKVWFIVEINSKLLRFNVYSQILDMYPERKRITLKLAQQVVSMVLNGEIKIIYKDGDLYLI